MQRRFDLTGLGAAIGRGVLWILGFRSRTLTGGVHVMERFARPPREGTVLGRDLLLIHGIGADMGHWAFLAFWLGRSHTIRLLDLPGHGASHDVEPVDLEVLNHVMVDAIRELPPSVVVGNSLGGAIALNLAVQVPGQVQGLFLISPAGPPMEEEEFRLTIGQFDMKTYAEARAFSRRLFASFPYNLGFIAPFVLATFRRSSLRRLRSAFTREGALTEEQATALTMPVHLTWGVRDGVLPVSLRDWLIAHIPGLQRADPDDEALEAHSPQVERPRSMARRILKFID